MRIYAFISSGFLISAGCDAALAEMGIIPRFIWSFSIFLATWESLHRAAFLRSKSRGMHGAPVTRAAAIEPAMMRRHR
jgi:hypothetical protein